MLRKVLLACIAQAFLFCSAAVAATVTSSWGGSTVYLLNPSYQATYLAAEAGDCAPVCATFTFFNSSFEESSYWSTPRSEGSFTIDDEGVVLGFDYVIDVEGGPVAGAAAPDVLSFAAWDTNAEGYTVLGSFPASILEGDTFSFSVLKDSVPAVPLPAAGVLLLGALGGAGIWHRSSLAGRKS